MAAIESADANRKYQVERLLVSLKNEIFGSGLANAHPARGNLVLRGGLRLRDRAGGSVNRKNVSRDESGRNCSSRCSRTTSDFEDLQVRLQRKGIDNR